MQSNYHFVILSASEESPKCINKWEILHTPQAPPLSGENNVQDDRAKR